MVFLNVIFILVNNNDTQTKNVQRDGENYLFGLQPKIIHRWW